MNEQRSRARRLGITPGLLAPGRWNAITDIEGVRIGQITCIEGEDVRTGATAILPHGGNPYTERVPAGLDVANGYGKMIGTTQVRELGEIETPIVLTNTLAAPRAADAILDWVLEQPGCETARSINPLVGETNDGRLNGIHRRVLTPEVIRRAIDVAETGPVEEGCVGAGTGTVAFGFKAGIGTSSRVLPDTLGGHSVGVLVQSNFAGVLQILGAPVGQALNRYFLKDRLVEREEHGSIMIVVATDAPLCDRNLTRLARRAFAGLARTGASFSNGSGDYAIAFSTHPDVRRRVKDDEAIRTTRVVVNPEMSPLFQAVIESTEEAVYNSLFAATTMSGRQGTTIEALPLEPTLALVRGRHKDMPKGIA